MARITILGSGPERPTSTRENSAMLLSIKNTHFLFDAGPRVDKLLKKHAGLEMKDLTAVFITHRHPDHYKGVELGLVPESVPVYFKKKYEDENVIVKPVPVMHSKIAPAVAFEIYLDGRKIVYAPDFIRARNDLFEGTDLFIADGSSFAADKLRVSDKTLVGHQAVKKTVEQARKNGTKRLLLTHLGRVGFTHSQLKERLKELWDKADVAEDGQVIELEEYLSEAYLSEAIELKTWPKALGDAKTRKLITSNLPGRILVAPHGELIQKRKKTAILSTVKDEENIRIPVYIVQDSKVWAKVVLAPPMPVTEEEFKQTQKQHRVSEDEVREWGWESKQLYLYYFQLVEVYDPVLECKQPPGAQRWIKRVEFKGEAPKEIGQSVLEEVKDIEDYDASKMDDLPLKDDFRLSAAWWSRLLQGKEFKYTKAQVLDLATKIVRELVKRKLVEFHPGTMMPAAKDLFDKIRRRLEDEGIEVPIAEVHPHGAHICYCPNCGWEEEYPADAKCREQSCPQCGCPLRAKEVGEYRAALVPELRRFEPDQLKELDSETLLKYHAELHQMQYAMLAPQEDLVNCNLWLLEEFERRGLEWPALDDDLDRRTLALLQRKEEVEEAELFYTTAMELGSTEQDWQEATSRLPRPLVPFIVTVEGFNLVGSMLYAPEGDMPNDADWLIRSPWRFPRLEEELQKRYKGYDHHFVYETKGPNWDYWALGDLYCWPLGQELPSVELTLRNINHPARLGFLEGFKPIKARKHYLKFSVSSEGVLQAWIHSPLDNGTMLKVEHFFHEVPVEIHFWEKAEELPEKWWPVADLWFIPYQNPVVHILPEPEFKEFYRVGRELTEAVRPLEPFTPMKAATSSEYRHFEFSDPEEAWELWAREKLEIE